jgi:hypothetical protein
LDFFVKEHGAIGNNTATENKGGSNFNALLLTYTQGVENTT